MSEADLKRIDAAVACITAGQQGTGYLIKPDLVATCHHVVKGAGPEAVIKLRFPHGEYVGRVLPQRDEKNDCAVVRLSQPVPAEAAAPLPLGSGCTMGESFWAVGYPSIGKGASLPINGMVIDAEWTGAGGIAATLLFSAQIKDDQAAGFSGSPVVIGGACVGHLKSIIPEAGLIQTFARAQFGYLYATPSRYLQGLVLDLPITQRQSQQMQPTRVSVRNLINAVTKGDVNFDNFFKSHYEKIYRKYITSGMDLVKKLNILLDYVEDRDDITQRLREDYPEEVSEHEKLLKYEAQASPGR